MESCKNLIAFGACMLFVGAAAIAQTQPDVLTELSATRIVGSVAAEKHESAATARPGDILEYRVRYSNRGKAKVRQLEITLPVPAGMIYLADSGRPEAAKASVDGVVYQAIPLKRIVTKKDGSAIEQPVPLNEYRFLRWKTQDLEAGKKLEVSARMKVDDGAAGAPAVR